MTLNQLVQHLTKLAANARSQHVRRIAPLIALVGDGIEHMGVHWEFHYKRQILLVVGTRRIVARYQHPKRTPVRQRGGIVFQERLRGNRLGPIVRGIYTLDDAITFRNRPTL